MFIFTQVFNNLSSCIRISTVSPHSVGSIIIAHRDGEPAIVSPEDDDEGGEVTGEVEDCAVTAVGGYLIITTGYNTQEYV